MAKTTKTTKTTTKICARCKVADAVWTCRDCGVKACEHLTGFKQGRTATCTACQLRATEAETAMTTAYYAKAAADRDAAVAAAVASLTEKPQTYEATDRNGEPVRVTVPEDDPVADRLTYSQEQAAVAAAAATFPATFGLRAYPGDRFRIDAFKSFYSDYAGGVQLVIQRDCGADGFRDFTRDLPAAIRAQMIDFEPTSKERADANRRAHDPASFERLAQLKAEAAARDLAASLAACTGAIAVTVHDGPVTVTVTQAQAEPLKDLDGGYYHADATPEDEALARQYDEATYPPAKATATATKACPRCKGTGTITVVASWKGGSAAPLYCTKCQGSGRVVKASRVRR